MDGTAAEGTAVDGTAEGTAVDGTAADGTAVDGKAAVSSERREFASASWLAGRPTARAARMTLLSSAPSEPSLAWWRAVDASCCSASCSVGKGASEEATAEATVW